MWTYTTYVLGKYCDKNPKRCEELEFEDLYNFIFNNLWLKEKLVFHDGMQDLLLDLDYLKKLGVISFEGNEDPKKITIKITNKEALSKISKIVDDSFTLTGVKIFDDYKKRIDRAIKNDPVVAT
jgi:hypothetical protein